MKLFHSVNSLVVSRNLRLILLSEIWLFLNLVKHKPENYCAYFFVALVDVEFFAILWFFTKPKLENISENYAATWWQKLAADFPSLDELDT